MKKIITLLTILLCLNCFSFKIDADEGDFYLDGILRTGLASTIDAISKEVDVVDRVVTLKLAKNIDLNSTDSLLIPSNCSVEIDLNGFDIYNSLLSIDKPLIINEGVFVVVNQNANSTGKIYIDNAAHKECVVLNKGIFDLDNGAIKNNSDITGASAIVSGFDGLSKNCKVYINGGDVYSKSGIAIVQHGYSTQYDSLVRVNDGTFNGGISSIKTTKDDGSYLVSLMINGGNFDTGLDVTNTKCVKNAYFKSSIDTNLIAEEYSQNSISGDYPYQITTSKEAKIGSTFYNTLKDALDNVKENDTIEVLKNIDQSQLDVNVPTNVTLDLCGYDVVVRSCGFFGYIIDSSEIIDADVNYYCRPQGSLEIFKKTEKRYLLRYLNSKDITVGDGYKLPVCINNKYKFYSLTGFDVVPGSTTGKVKFRPIIGFKPNSVWKEILATNSTNINVGAIISGVGYVVASSGLNKVDGGMIFLTNKASEWANYCGYGTFIISLSGKDLTRYTKYTITPFIYDNINNLKYKCIDSITRTYME